MSVRRPDLPTDAGRRPPPMIPGVYNYCDRWCERCPLTARCEVFRDQARDEAAMTATLAAPHAFLDQPFDQDDEVPVPPEVAAASAELVSGLDEATRSETAEESERLTAAWRRHRQRVRAHPIPTAAREYAALAQGVLQAVSRLVEGRPGTDETARLAVETLRWHAPLIAVRSVRAAAGLVPDDPVGDGDDGRGNGPDEVQSDANGTAKLVRLLIGESIDAWRALSQPGRGVANGVPLAMIDRLDRLDRQVADAFPKAMAFVRPGFDDGEPPGAA